MRLDKVIFCEDVRVEQSGLLTLVGVVAGDTISILRSGDRVLLPIFSTVFVLDGMDQVTSFTWQMTVTFGSRQIYQSQPTVQQRDVPTRHHNIIQRLIPFVLDAAGQYDFQLAIQTGASTRTFGRSLIVEYPPAKSPVQA